MNCQDIEDLAGAIALGAVPEEEWADVREHLATCANAHTEVRRLLPIADLLLEAAPPVEPPAGLRERILAAARAEPRSEGSPVPLASATPAPVPITMTRSWWRQPAWGVAAAAILVAAALAVWNISLQRNLTQTEQQLAAGQRVVEALAMGGQAAPVNSTISGASGALVRHGDGNGSLVLHGLSPQPGRTYQVWALRGGQPVSLGVFDPTTGGATIVRLNTDLRTADAVAITIEPGPSGSALPTSQPVLVAPLSG